MKDKIIIILAGVLWGFVGVITTQIFSLGFSSYAIVEFRFLFSAIIVFIGLFIFNKNLLKPQNIKQCFLLGVCNLLTCVCYYNAIKYIGSGVASILLYTSPIMVMVYCSVKGKTKITAKMLLAVAFCVLGCCLSGGNKYSFNIKGLVFGLFSAIFNSLVSIVGAKIKSHNKTTINFYSFLSSSIVGLVFIRASAFTKLYNIKASVLFLALCMFCTVIPYILYIGALKKGQEDIASMLCISEPITANLIQIIIDKKISVITILGLIFLIIGVILVSVNNKKGGNLVDEQAKQRSFRTT